MNLGSTSFTTPLRKSASALAACSGEPALERIVTRVSLLGAPALLVAHAEAGRQGVGEREAGECGLDLIGFRWAGGPRDNEPGRQEQDTQASDKSGTTDDR